MLQSDIPRVEIYNDYVEAFPHLAEGAKEWLQQPDPKTTLKFSEFLRYWCKGNPALRVAEKGSYFCD